MLNIVIFYFKIKCIPANIVKSSVFISNINIFYSKIVKSHVIKYINFIKLKIIKFNYNINN